MVCSLYDSADIVFANVGAFCGSTSIITFQPYDWWEPSSSKTNNPFTLRCTDFREPNVVIISNPFNVGTATYTYSPQPTNPIPWYIEDPISTYMSFYVIPTGAAS